jgi:PAS domain S-box-containing protein
MKEEITAPIPGLDNSDLLQSALDAIPLAAWVCDRKGVVTHVNSLAGAMWTGGASSDLVGRRLHDLCVVQSRAACKELVGRALGGETAVGRVGALNLGGGRLGLNVRMSPLRDGAGAVNGALSVAQEVTEPSAADQKRRDMDRHWVEAQRMAHVGSWEWDVRTGGNFWSDENYRIFGHEPGAVRPTHDLWVSGLHPDDRERVLGCLESALEGKAAYDVECRYLHRGGRVVHVHCRGEVYRDESGKPVRMAGTVQDITEQRLAERRALDAERVYRAIFDQAGVGVSELDCRTFRFLRVNPKFCEILGRTEAQVLGGDLAALTHPDDWPLRNEHYRRLLAGEVRQFTMEKRYIRPDGEIVWARVIVSALWQPGEEPSTVVAMVQDITAETKSERALRLAQFTLNRAADSIFWIAPTGTIIFVNDSAARMLGYAREELVGKTVSDIDPNFPQEAWPAHWEDLKRRGSFGFESSHLTKDGRLLKVEVAVNYIQFEGQEYNCGIARDITERKRTEQQLSAQHQEIWRLDRFRTMEQLSGSLAHELNQPLGAILNYADGAAELIERGKATLANISPAVRGISDEAKRAGEITRWLRTLVRDSEPRLSPVDINSLIERSVQLLNHEVRPLEVAVRTDLAGDLPKVTGDNVGIIQVLLNLLRNGVEAMRSEKASGSALRVVSYRDGDFVRVDVVDGGCGWPDGKMAQMFEPFFTTKRDGMGIGLSICRSVIGKCGGELTGKANAERGMTFSFTLCVAK